MNHDKILCELEDLLSIPEFKRILVHRIEELKLLLSKDIEHYRNITGMIIPPGKKKLPGGIHFELIRVGNSLWIPSLPERPECETYEYIPQVIIDYIVDFKLEQGGIKMISGLKFPGLKGRIFNLNFEKHSGNFISGIIVEKKAKKVKDNDIDPVPPENVSFSDMESLFRYLLIYPGYYRHVIREFLLMWKPLLDSNNVRCENSS